MQWLGCLLPSGTWLCNTKRLFSGQGNGRLFCDRGIFGFSEKQEGIYSIVNQFIKDMLFLGMHADGQTSLSQMPWQTWFKSFATRTSLRTDQSENRRKRKP
jgi:hypothetical protein